MAIDPFSLKALPYYDPKRAAYTLWFRYQDWLARRRFACYAIPLKHPPEGPVPPPPNADTAVTPEQYRCLWAALRATDYLTGTSFVEVGAYRGVTTRYLTEHARRPVVAIDPFIGYGGNLEDFAAFRANTAGLSTLTHRRVTSGEGAAHWTDGRTISLIFIDAVHDYANTRFDIANWMPLLAPGGIIALHDVDLPEWAGTRRAAAELLPRCSLFAHVENLVLFQVA
jgi:predicted O-methyltransferase YrrM